jgi:hypothetical protein
LFSEGCFILLHGRSIEEKALGAFAAFGPTTAAALLTLGTYGLASPLLATLTGTAAAVEGGIAANVAYQVAREGGRHASLLRNYADKSANQIQKGIKALQELPWLTNPLFRVRKGKGAPPRFSAAL